MKSEGPDYSRFEPATCWASSWQRLLLRAVVGPEGDRRSAWDEFCKACDLERLDSASASLISLLWTAIAERGIGGGDRPRIKGAWRQQWTHHETLKRTLRDLAARLAEDDLDVAIVEDTASALVDYPGGILRPWTALKLAVRRDVLPAVSKILHGMAWKERPDPVAKALGVSRWTKEGLADLDLRLSLFPECVTDDECWGRMVAVTVEGMELLALPRVERLIHLSYHGIRWMPATPLLSYVDAAMISRLLSVDERRSLVAMARQWRMTAAVRRLMVCLEELGADGAGGVAAEMGGDPASLVERIETRLRDRRNGRFLAHARDWLRARRLRRAGSL